MQNTSFCFLMYVIQKMFFKQPGKITAQSEKDSLQYERVMSHTEMKKGLPKVVQLLTVKYT